MMQKNGGYLGFCCPPHIYAGNANIGPTDPNLLHAIQLLHGYQLTHRLISFYLDIFVQDKNRDGLYAYDMFETYKSQNDPASVSDKFKNSATMAFFSMLKML